MSRRVILILLVFSMPWLVAADEPGQLTPGPGCQLSWDYPEGVDLLASFSLWKRPVDGNYPTLPTKLLPSMKALVTRIQCDTIAWGAPGIYYIQVTAGGITGEVSGPSNELLVRWGLPEDVPPPVPPPVPDPSPPPRSYLPPTPPPLIVPPPIARTDPPSEGQGWLSETCQWTGTCQW